LIAGRLAPAANKASGHWIDEFYYWLEAQGLTRPVQ
jgi:hypothetical protein